MDLGLEAAGFDCVGCLEWNEDAQRSLKANRSDAWPLIGDGDVASASAELKPSDLGLTKGDLDLLVGAPPCQPFSKAAQWSSESRQGMQDDRSGFVADFFAIAAAFVPKYVLIENVPGYVQGPTSALADLHKLVKRLAARTDAPYRLDHRILNAADFGVPQNRRRALVLVTRCTDITWPEHVERRTAWDAIGEPPTDQETFAMSGQWADLLPTIPEGGNYQWHTERGQGQPLFGYRTRYWSFLQKLHRNCPSPTIAASPGPSTGPFHWDSRPLTVWERLRLQTFPGEWLVEGDRRSQIRQIGNATPPLLAELVGRSIATALGGPIPPRTEFHVAKLISQTSPFAGSNVVPLRYQKRIGGHKAHPGTGLGPAPRQTQANNDGQQER